MKFLRLELPGGEIAWIRVDLIRSISSDSLEVGKIFRKKVIRHGSWVKMGDYSGVFVVHSPDEVERMIREANEKP